MNYKALQIENEGLKTTNWSLQVSIRDLKESTKEILFAKEEQLQNALDQITQLQRIIYGRKSERFVYADNQLNLFSGQVELEQPNEEVKTQQIPSHERKVKKSKHKGRTLISQCSHLEVEDIILEAEGGPDSIKIGEAITEKLAYRIGKLYIKRTIRPKHKDPKTEKISIAELPSEPLPKCEADVSLLAYVPVSKFVDHLPEYRIQQIFKREGVKIAPATMNNWTHKIAQLLNPLCNHLKMGILQTGYVQMDESTIRVMAGKKNKTHLGYMWVMNSPQKNQVYFEYHEGRGREGPEKMIKDYQGILQTDGYKVYDNLASDYPDIELINCWAHARRYFEKALPNDKARAEKVMLLIQKLYGIEKNWRELSEKQKSPQSRIIIRIKEAKPLLDELKIYLDEQYPMVLPKSLIGKAMAYTLKRWKKLTGYLEDGRIEIDNNLIENSIRPLALGRKNYLFAGNHDAATNIANFYTVFGTCKKQGVNPYDYLVWYLERVSDTSIQNIASLSPVSYKKLTENLE